MNWEALDISIIGPALVAGLIVVSTHVPLGREVLRRGIIFIDLAVAQIAGIGVIAAGVFGWHDGWAVQLAAVTAAMIGAIALTFTERLFGEDQEAMIGVAFVLAATAGILLLASDPHGGDALKELLVGQILWVQLGDLWPIALLYAVALVLWFRFGEQLGRLGFYLLFAVVVTASVQLVGVYLVFASLIIPALAVRRIPGRAGLWVGYGMGVSAYLVGLAVSAVSDLPTGAVIVWSLGVLGVIIGTVRSIRQGS